MNTTTLDESSAKQINLFKPEVCGLFSYYLTENINLKLLELRHSDELFAATDTNRVYLREWLPWVDGTISVTQSRNFINASLNQFANNNGMNLGIFYNDSIIGCIGLHQIDWNNLKASIGYWLAKKYQGQGIMTQACNVMIKYIFEELQLNRIEIRAASTNTKSRAIPERLGFVLEGQIRQAEMLNGRLVDHVVYGLLQEDWIKQ